MNKEVRPILQVPKTRYDQVVEYATIFLLIGLWGLTVWLYQNAPDIIPTHYGPSGQPDDWGSKNSLWMVAILATLLFAGQFWLSGRPHLYNYLKPITEHNAAREYARGARLIRLMGFSTTLVFCLLQCLTLTHLWKIELNFSVLLLIVALPLLPLVWYFNKA